MAVEFDDVKEIVRAVALRLDSPSSKYSFIFSESDDAVEVSIEVSGSLDPIFVFVVDAERFRVLKALDLDQDSYVSFAYHSHVELLSYIIQYFYPVYFKLSNYGTLNSMLSRVLGKRIRIWKDLLRVICEAGQVEFYDRGKVFKVLETNFAYNLENQTLTVSGELNDVYKCRTTMELITTLFTVLAYIFQLNELEINPLFGVQLVEEGDDSLFDAEMAMGEDIDSMGMGGGDIGGDMGEGEDLSNEFVPAGDSVENTAPDMSEGKNEIMDEVNANYSPSKGNKPILSAFITSGGGAWFSPQGKFYLLDSSHEQFVNENGSLFNCPTSLSGDDLVSHALTKGWVRIRGEQSDINVEIHSGSRCVSRLSAVAHYLVSEAGHDPSSSIALDIYSSPENKGVSIRCTLQELMDESASIPSYLTSAKNYTVVEEAVYKSGGVKEPVFSDYDDNIVLEASTSVTPVHNVSAALLEILGLCVEYAREVSVAFSRLAAGRFLMSAKGGSGVEEDVSDFLAYLSKTESYISQINSRLRDAKRLQDAGLRGSIQVKETNRFIDSLNDRNLSIGADFFDLLERTKEAEEDLKVLLSAVEKAKSSIGNMRKLFSETDELITYLEVHSPNIKGKVNHIILPSTEDPDKQIVSEAVFTE